MADDGAGDAFLSYGRLSIQVLVAVTGASAIALLALLAMLLTSRAVTPGLPYGDVPAALIAMGGAVSLATLASASAYFAQYALHRSGRPLGDGSPEPAPSAAIRRWTTLAAACHLSTSGLMSLAYLAFGIGGAVFIHFCVAAIPVFARLGG